VYFIIYVGVARTYWFISRNVLKSGAGAVFLNRLKKINKTTGEHLVGLRKLVCKIDKSQESHFVSCTKLNLSPSARKSKLLQNYPTA